MKKNVRLNNSYYRLIYPRKDMRWFALGFLGWFIFYALPFVLSLITSLIAHNNVDHSFFLNNYIILLHDSYYFLSIKNTFFFLFPAIISTLVLSLIIAQTIFTIPKLRILLIVLVLPLFLPASSIAAIWNIMVGSGSPLAQLVHMHDEQWKYISLFLLYFWKNTGAVVTLYLTGMHALDESMLDAAQIDGASKRILFFQIELPLLKNVSIFAILYLLMNGVRIFRESYMLYGAYPPPNLYFVQHHINLSFARLDFGLLSAAGIVFSGLILCLFFLLWRILRHNEEATE